MAFLNGLLGGGTRQAQPSTGAQQAQQAQQPGLLGGFGGFGDQFNRVRTENPEALLALAAGLLNGNVGAGVAGMAEATAGVNQDKRRADLQREGWGREDQRFAQTFGLQQQQFGLEKAAFDSNAQQTRAQQNATAQFLRANGADPSLVTLAESGQGAAAFKMYTDMKGGGTEFGTTPVYGTDKDGNIVIGQMGKNGTLVQSRGPEGFTPLPPGELSQQKAWGTATGKAQGEAGAQLPAAQQAAETVSQQVKDLKDDPYLPSMLGPIDSRLPNYSSDAARVQGKINQLQGGAFLQARQMLKGGGAITDYEGQKAEQAFIRLNQAQSVGDFNAALDEFDGYVKQGLAKLQASTGGRAAAPPAGGSSLKQKYGLE